jgi:hypothetical protein
MVNPLKRVEAELFAWPEVSVHPHRFGVGNSDSETQKLGTSLPGDSRYSVPPLNARCAFGRRSG